MNTGSNNISTFTTCLKLLEDANKCMKDYLRKDDYESVILAYTKHQVAIFIDVDYARSEKDNYIRGQLYEAAELFSKNGGEIYAITSNPKSYFDHGNYLAFTDVFRVNPIDGDTNKVNIIKQHALWFKHDYDLFIFGNDVMYSLLEQYKVSTSRHIICNVLGTTFLELYDHHSPCHYYTVVEYILFYLSSKLLLKNIHSDVTF